MGNPFTEFQNRVLGLYVEHPEVKKVWDDLERRRMLRRRTQEVTGTPTPSHVWIMGRSRVGKTKMMEHYLERNPKSEKHVDGKTVDVKPVVYVIMPSPFTYKEFFSRIIDGLGAPRIPKEDISDMKNRIFKLFKEQEVEMLIIDEMDCIKKRAFATKADIMETIKDIGNKAKVCLVCVGTEETDELRTLNSQHIGRFSPLNIPHFKEYDEAFLNLLSMVEKQLNPGIDLRLGERGTLSEMLYEASAGLIGWLTPILINAMILVGVFNDDFNDFSVLHNINGTILFQAREMHVGDITEDDVTRLLGN